jgi:transmembrane sensor
MTSDFKVLMQRFHDKTITREELAEFCKLINSGMYDEYWGNELFSSLYTEPNAIVGKDQPALERAYTHAINAKETALQPTPATTGKTRILKFMIAAAAMIALALLAMVWILAKNNSPEKILVEFLGPARFELPDQSRILLDHNTKLTYTVDAFGKGTREVTLTGQAFFEVTHDASAPFIVHTETVTTKVLGTSFNVNAQPGKDKRVTVSEGKVEVKQGEGHRDNITPGQQIMVSMKGNAFIKREVNADTVLAWKKKFLIFDRVSLAEAAQRIEERFDVTITFASEDLKSVIIDAAFVSDQDVKINHVLEVLSTTANATFAIENGAIMLSAKERDPSF